MYYGKNDSAILSECGRSVIHCINYLITSPAIELMWFLNNCSSVVNKFVKICKWEENDDYKWAINIDLTVFGKENEEAIIPFHYGVSLTEPRIEDGIIAWRIQKGKEL